MAFSGYASRDDLVKRYGEAEILELENVAGKDLDASLVALQDGAAEINGYIGLRYKLPLTPGEFPVLIWLNCEISRYRLWENRLEDNEENAVYVRYKQAVKHLKDISEGNLALMDENGGEPELAIGGAIGSVANRRPQVYTNKVLKKMNYGY